MCEPGVMCVIGDMYETGVVCDWCCVRLVSCMTGVVCDWCHVCDWCCV